MSNSANEEVSNLMVILAVVFLFAGLLGIAMLAYYESNANERHKDNPDAIVEGACVVHLLDGRVGIVVENGNDSFNDRFGVRFGSMESWKFYTIEEFRRCTDAENFR